MKRFLWILLVGLLGPWCVQAQGLRWFDMEMAQHFDDPEGAYAQARPPATFAAPEDFTGQLALTVNNCNGYLEAFVGQYQPVGAKDFQAAYAYRDCPLLWLLVRSRPAESEALPVLEELNLSQFEPFSTQGAHNLKELAAISRGLFQPKHTGILLTAEGLKLGLFWVLQADFDGSGTADALLELRLGEARQWVVALSRPGGGYSVISLERLIARSRR